MFEKTLKLFLSKTPTIKTKDPLQGHLPNKLYAFLQKNDLLGQEKNFQIELPGKSEGDALINCSAKIKVDVLSGSGMVPTTAQIKITLETPDGPVDSMQLFSNREWYMEGVIANGFDYVKGNSRSCPFNGLTDKQCKGMTSNKVKDFIEKLSLLKANQVSTSPRPS